MTRDDIQRVMDEVSGLNDFGIGVYDEHRKSFEERSTELKKGQVRLLESEDACTRCCEWLADVATIKSINPRHTSYGLKHVAEVDIGYITNGVFIAAAVHAGFEFETEHRSPNVQFNMSEKSLKAIKMRQQTEGKRNYGLTGKGWP